MRRTPVAGLCLVLALALAPAALASPVLTLDRDGRAHAREDRYLPRAQDAPGSAVPAGGRRTSPRAGAAARRTVAGELRRLLRTEAIGRSTYDRYRRIDADARRTRGRLSGARRIALGATLYNLDEVAARGLLSASRAPALFETVRRNREWWTRGPLLASGQRVTFSGSRLVWQHYPGQGLQIQWLGTFGKANALFHDNRDKALRALLDESLRFAGRRSGEIAFEYLFRFGGGRPPWVSGLAQGTAAQALARGGSRLHEPRYARAAHSALGIFRRAPSNGVRVRTGAGSHYLIYSFAPGLRVLNAFVQAVNGLHDVALLNRDSRARALFAAGERELRRELPRYDTGGWSMYSNYRESDLGYHVLLRDFLRNLCERMTDDEKLESGGPARGADPAPYCRMARRFTGYLKAAPRLRLRTTSVRSGRSALVGFSVDKPATVTMSIRRGSSTVMRTTLRLTGGRHAYRWSRVRRAGAYTVTLSATDLAGNRATRRGALRAHG